MKKNVSGLGAEPPKAWGVGAKLPAARGLVAEPRPLKNVQDFA